MVENHIYMVPDLSDDIAITSFSESACSRLICRSFESHELPSLIEGIFLNKGEDDAINCLKGGDAETFVDIMDQALDELNLLPWIRKKCLRALYKTCGRNSILPKSLQIPLCYDRQGFPLYSGGYADVWKGKHRGRDVAVKVIRTPSYKDLQQIVPRFCREVMTWKALRHPNVLSLIGVTMNECHFAMVSEWMENGTIREFVQVHPDADRLGLLVDVAKGLMYIHGQGMIHGDLKGANILVDQTGRARLADFGLLTIMSDPSHQLSSTSSPHHGTVRWMSPELLHPEELGFEKSRPTEASDCYALGMVIYEVISGQLPFHEHPNRIVNMIVMKGERPAQGAEFPDTLWGMLELCWMPQPSDRPSIEAVFQCLERVLALSKPPPPPVDEITATVEDGDDCNSVNGTLGTETLSPVAPVGRGLYSPGSWHYIDLCVPQKCEDCGQFGHASRWRYCPKNALQQIGQFPREHTTDGTSSTPHHAEPMVDNPVATHPGAYYYRTRF